MAAIKTGIVMNGPIPIMFDMFSAVACSKPKRLGRLCSAGCGIDSAGVGEAVPILSFGHRSPILSRVRPAVIDARGEIPQDSLSATDGTRESASHL